MHDINKILVVSTSTSTSRNAIHTGMVLAKQLGAELYVYHSDYHPFDIEGWGLPIPSLRELRATYREVLEKDRAVLNKIIKKQKTPGMSVEVFVNEEPLVHEVPRIVHEKQIDLIIFTAFEEGRLEHMVYSHSIHEIVRTMPCSVMLVKERHSWEKQA